MEPGAERDGRPAIYESTTSFISCKMRSSRDCGIDAIVETFNSYVHPDIKINMFCSSVGSVSSSDISSAASFDAKMLSFNTKT